ncbi:MAG: hypothetical protein KBG84_03165, partial [Planctomycetes bacterium]|nr:hypothetical protein [Planctomycetota bacterium]
MENDTVAFDADVFWFFVVVAEGFLEPEVFWFLAESYGFGWGELAGEGVEEFAQWGADQVDHGDERVHVSV